MNARSRRRKSNPFCGAFTFVEVLSTCPTNWGMTPIAAQQWLKDNMVPYYPLGVIKDTAANG